MQKLIAKYGLAAHLALLAVAPLFLLPFCSVGWIALVLIWLTLPAALWTILEPSVRGGERLHEARRRVIRSVLRDPLFWASVALVAFTGFRAINTGITLSYNAETAAWFVSLPPFPILPGVVGAAGDLPFAVSLACAVLLQGCRHSLGRSARMAFLLLSSFLSGMAGLTYMVALHEGFAGVVNLLPSSDGLVYSFAGMAFGLHLIGGLVSLVAIFEQRWRFSFFLLIPAICGNVAGLFSFSQPYLFMALAAAAIVMFAYVFGYTCKAYPPTGGFKLLVIGSVALTLGGLLVVAVLPKDMMEVWLASLLEFKPFPERFWEIRSTLSAMAFKSWVAHLWIGTGIDSFPLDFRFSAQDSDWALLPRGATSLANGWWFLLAERGLVGTVFFILPLGFLMFTYIRRMVGSMRGWALPHPATLVAPVVLVLFVADGFFDCSLLRAEVLMVTCAFLAVSAATFKRMRGSRNG